MNKYQEEIYNWCLERHLKDGIKVEECDHCKEKSIYVEDFDTSYRHMNAEPNYVKMCVFCYYELIVEPMNSQWSDYYASIL